MKNPIAIVATLALAAGTVLAAGTPAGAPAAAAVADELKVQSAWDFVLKGGIMMIPIGVCSLVALTVVAERLITLRRRRVIPPSFAPEVRKRLGKDGKATAAAIEYCRKDGSAIARVFAAGLRRSGAPVEVVERHIQDAGTREVFRLRKYLRVLSVIAAVSPLLGLLGTIFGMITAFQTVATSAEALGRTELLAEGIYEAMITTAGGLVVAIPALICYHWLSARVQKLVMEIDELAVDFIEDLIGGVTPRPYLAAGGNDALPTDARVATN